MSIVRLGPAESRPSPEWVTMSASCSLRGATADPDVTFHSALSSPQPPQPEYCPSPVSLGRSPLLSRTSYVWGDFQAEKVVKPAPGHHAPLGAPRATAPQNAASRLSPVTSADVKQLQSYSSEAVSLSNAAEWWDGPVAFYSGFIAAARRRPRRAGTWQLVEKSSETSLAQRKTIHKTR